MACNGTNKTLCKNEYDDMISKMNSIRKLNNGNFKIYHSKNNPKINKNKIAEV
jgi:hypothetical protein